jgi:hypothetical protein
MHGTTRTRPTTQPVATGVNAVVWIEPGRALVVRGSAGEAPASMEWPVPVSYSDTPPVLAEIARRIGEVDRVLVLGNAELRIALEREIVAIGHRPETIREVAANVPMDETELIARLAQLA